MNQTVLITGATSGIGREFARRYAAKGCRLILVGRREERLEQLRQTYGQNCRTIRTDLAEEQQCRHLLEKVKDEAIDIFINNAGFGTAGSFLETDMEREAELILVNDLAMHLLFKGILAQMEERGEGTILNVASSAGLFPGGPYMAAYYASKAYVVSLTRAVAEELRQKGSRVYVCALCPGPVNTEFNEHAGVVFALRGISVKRCVRESLFWMKRRRVVIVPTLRMKAAVFFQHFVPGPLLIRMVAGQQKKKLASP